MVGAEVLLLRPVGGVGSLAILLGLLVITRRRLSVLGGRTAVRLDVADSEVRQLLVHQSRLFAAIRG